MGFGLDSIMSDSEWERTVLAGTRPAHAEFI